MKNLLIFTSIFFLALKAQSQNVGIGTSTPATILDVTSTTQGVLIPRVTQVQMLAIPTPANGLLVTNTDSLNRLFIYTGTAWKGLSFTSESSTDTSGFAHKNYGLFETIDGFKTFTQDLLIHGMTFGRGGGVTGGYPRNVVIGLSALAGANTGRDVIAIGNVALVSNTSGTEQVAIGTAALLSNTTGTGNMGIGIEALVNNSAGSGNVALGNFAGSNLSNGVSTNDLSDNSVFIGANTKALASGQTNQIVIGNNATGLGSNTAIIGNSTTTTTGISGKLFLANGLNTAPSSSSDAGTTGEIRVTATFIYVCTAPNTWVRSPLTTW